MTQKLTDHERQFVNEWIKDSNPVLACERMGYDELVAPDVAYEMLGLEHVKDAMAEAFMHHKYYNDMNNMTPADLGVNDAYIVMRLKSIADRAQKTTEQLKAIELLGKTIGIFKDSTKVEVTDNKKSVFSAEDRRIMMEHIKRRKAADVR